MYYDSINHQLMLCQSIGGIWGFQFINGLWALNGTNLYPNGNNWNVGIGTTNPLAKLHVMSNTAGVERTMYLQATDPIGAVGNNSPGINFLTSTGGAVVGGDLAGSPGGLGLAGWNGAWANGTTAGDFVITARDGANLVLGSGPAGPLTETARVFISSNGNVGVGTNNPQARLHVEGGNLLGAARDTAGNAQRICSGRTPVGATAWVVYPDGTATSIYVDVDTRACGFTAIPVYIANLSCDSSCWQSTGSYPYARTARGFRIYIKSPWVITPAEANTYRWHIEWAAFGN
jgi:hypothetical protein